MIQKEFLDEWQRTEDDSNKKGFKYYDLKPSFFSDPARTRTVDLLIKSQ
jgi:hypothetical protein